MDFQPIDIVSLLWFVFWVIVLFGLKKELKSLLSIILGRLERGSGLKLWELELPETKYESSSNQPEPAVVGKTSQHVPGLSPDVEKAIGEAVGGDRVLILTNSITRLYIFVTRFAKRESSYWIGGVTLPEGFESLPLRQKIQIIKAKLPPNVVKDLISVSEMQDKLATLQVKDLSNADFIKSVSSAYLKAERLIDYFQGRLSYVRT